MNERDKIVDKIKKLLRMKRGGTPDEVATALRMAQELAEKHDINLNDVNPDDEAKRENPISHEDQILGARMSLESKYASMIVDRFFKVSAFKNVNGDRTKYVITFVGEEWDIQIAIYVYRFLCGHFRRAWKTGRGRLRNREAFLWGMYLGLRAKLQDRQPDDVQQPGIVRAERALARRTQYIGAYFGDLKKQSAAPDNDSHKARWSGFMAGQATEIRSGVKGGETRQGLQGDGETKLLA